MLESQIDLTAPVDGRLSAAQREWLEWLRFERARAPGKGVILTTGHFGNWEMHGIAHGFKLGRINVLARVQSNRFLNQWLENVRGISGNKVIYKARKKASSKSFPTQNPTCKQTAT